MQPEEPLIEGLGLGGWEVCAGHDTPKLYADDPTSLDLEHVRSTTRGVGSWPRPGNLGQPHVPHARLFVHYTLGFQGVMTKSQYTYEASFTR